MSFLTLSSLPALLARLDGWRPLGRLLPPPRHDGGALATLLSYGLTLLLPLLLFAVLHVTAREWTLRQAEGRPLASWRRVLPACLALPAVVLALGPGWPLALSALLAAAAVLAGAQSALRRPPPSAVALGKQVLILGHGALAGEMYRRSTTQRRYRIRAIFTGEQAGGEAWSGVHHIAREQDVAAYLAEHAIDEIWIALPLDRADQLQRFRHLLRHTLIDIRWIQDVLSLPVLSSKPSSVLDMPAINLNCPDRSLFGTFKKELFDKLFSAAALLCLSPLLLLIALGIKCASPGPAIYRQQRLGLDGKVFSIYKFRTMRVDPDGGPFRQTARDDPRLFRLGAFLRRTSLDELPQFFNVLRGDMSVVGPRPHALPHNDMFKDLLDVYMVRHRVKPGITGWAQINGQRGEAATVDKMQKRIQLDLYYIQHWSFGLDLRIIALTVVRGWSGHNVY